ncbi:MAG: DUF6522 family protein, partial [Rhodospirillaceae bacterium]
WTSSVCHLGRSCLDVVCFSSGIVNTYWGQAQPDETAQSLTREERRGKGTRKMGSDGMCEVSRTDSGFVVEAAALARAFEITEEQVREEMRTGLIRSRSEIGAGQDEGRWRMTFYRADRAFRLVVNAEGEVLTRGRFPVTPRSRSGRRD